jgi:hypothetical protein
LDLGFHAFYGGGNETQTFGVDELRNLHAEFSVNAVAFGCEERERMGRKCPLNRSEAG